MRAVYVSHFSAENQIDFKSRFEYVNNLADMTYDKLFNQIEIRESL